MNALLEAQRLLENLEYTRKQNSAGKNVSALAFYPPLFFFSALRGDN
jgi:hypothetical protein